MNAKEFIEKYLQNCRYNSVITKEAEKAAKENGLVVVFGASDDLCEFRGAVDDEVDCFDGEDIYINADGKIANNDYEFDDFDPEIFPEFKLISAVWCERGRECSWSYRTDIPHEEFTVWDEDNTYYCFGIVFNLGDIPHEVKKYVDVKELLDNAYYIEEDAVVSADFIRSKPAADVAPVVHAEWIENDENTIYCTNCAKLTDKPEHGEHYDYCPRCGAKMDGDENG